MPTIAELEQQARECSGRGDMPGTERACRAILDQDDKHLPSLRFLADFCLRSGNFPEAGSLLQQLIALTPDDADRYSQLGQALYRQDKKLEAAEAYKQYWQLNPRNMMVYLALGCLYVELDEIDKAAQVFSLGEAIDKRILSLWREEGTNPDLKQMTKTAYDTLSRHHTDLHLQTVAKVGDESELSRIRDAVWPLLDAREVSYAHDKQRSQVFYIQYPEAPGFFERETLPWCEGFEAQFEELKEEIIAGLDVEADGRPYLGDGHKLEGELWEPLVNKMSWASVHLYSQGVANPQVIDKFPKTCAALTQIPAATYHGNPKEAFISVLAPNTRIPEHYGVSSAVLTVHLPIIVPGDCGLMVNGEVRVPEEGKILAFDDTWEHAAWNNTDQPRVVLIFELWHPALTELEKEAILETFYVRDAWVKNRTIGGLSSR